MGLEYSATDKDVKEQAKLFGILIDKYIKENQENEEKEQQLKAKLFEKKD